MTHCLGKIPTFLMPGGVNEKREPCLLGAGNKLSAEEKKAVSLKRSITALYQHNQIKLV